MTTFESRTFLEAEVPIVDAATFPPVILFPAAGVADVTMALTCETSFTTDAEVDDATVFPSIAARRDVETSVDATDAVTEENFSFETDGVATAATDLPCTTDLFEVTDAFSEETFPTETERANDGVAEEEAVRK